MALSDALVRQRQQAFTSCMKGPIGVVDTTLKEEGYDDLRDGPIEYQTEENGGWIGFTDKYWLTALVPDQSQKVNFSMRALAGNEDRYQTDYLGAAMVLNKGRRSLMKHGSLPVLKS